MAWFENIDLRNVIAEVQDEHDLSRVEEPCPDDVRTKLANSVRKSVVLSRFAPRIEAAKSIAEVNRILALVYDEADLHRVWCGM